MWRELLGPQTLAGAPLPLRGRGHAGLNRVLALVWGLLWSDVPQKAGGKVWV